MKAVIVENKISALVTDDYSGACVDLPIDFNINDVDKYMFVEGMLVIPVYKPTSITPRQARLKLLEADLLDNLEAVITTNRAWQIEWEYATEVKRDSPLIDAVASEAGLTSEQIDQMFLEASKL